MRQIAYLLTVIFPVSLVLWSVLPVSAQTASPGTVPHPKPPYLSVPIPTRPDNWKSYEWRRQHAATVQRIRSGSTPLPENQKIFDDWYNMYELRRLVEPGNTDVEALNNSALALSRPEDVRQELLRRHLAATRNQNVYEHLTKLLFDFMTKVVAPREPQEFHPVVRYNAMMIIGELNSRKEVPIGQNKSPAVPLPAALEFMIAQLTDPKQIDAVRVAALNGIMRQAQMSRFLSDAEGIGLQEREQINNIMVDLLKQREPPKGRTADGQQWMQRTAATILGYLGSPGSNNAVANALVAVMNDPQYSLRVRTASAAALGDLKAFRTGDAKSVVQGVAALAYEAVEQELDSLEKYKEKVALRRKLATEKSNANIEADIQVTDRLAVRAGCAKIKYQCELLHKTLLTGETLLLNEKPAGIKNALADPAVASDIDTLAASLKKVADAMSPNLNVDLLLNELVQAETTFRKAAGIAGAAPVTPVAPPVGPPTAVPEKPTEKPENTLPF